MSSVDTHINTVTTGIMWALGFLFGGALLIDLHFTFTGIAFLVVAFVLMATAVWMLMAPEEE